MNMSSRKHTPTRQEIKTLIEEETKRGYLHVSTPDMARLELYEKSGHYPHYKDSMFAPIEMDDEKFMLTYGDAVADVNLADLYKFHQERGKTVTVTGVQPPSPFGVMATNEGLVKAFTEKPQSEDWTNGGFFVCNNKIFDYLSSDGTTVFEQEPLKRLASEGELAIYHHRNFWHCVDTFKHLEGLNAYYQKGNRPWMIWEQKQNS